MVKILWNIELKREKVMHLVCIIATKYHMLNAEVKMEISKFFNDLKQMDNLLSNRGSAIF